MVWRFSKTASANATADSSINFAEGQAPSSINDSARAEMARVAQWRDDISGTIATGGTSSAFTVTSNQVFDTLAHMDGAIIAFVPHATNAASCTLSVDGLAAKKIRTQTGVDITDGSLVLGTPYVATYYNAVGEFLLHNLAGNPYGIPLGGLLWSTTNVPPNSSFVLPYGQAISRTTYASYFTAISTTYGAGDGSTTFNVVDMRGRGMVALDNMGGSAANRVTAGGSGIDGTQPGAVGGEQTHILTVSELAAHNHGGATGGQSVDHTHSYSVAISSGFTAASNGGSVSGAAFGTTNTGTTSTDHTHSIPNQGGGAAHNNMPPTVILPCFVRII